MAGIQDEEEFDAFAAGLDIRPAAAGMEVPWLCLGGEFDELSPIEHTYELAATMKDHASLVVYEGAGHGLAGVPSTMIGPDWRTFAADWLLDRANGVPDEEMSLFVTRTGATESRPHPRDTP
jgi:pimeloyl-ACP methyl ester carboxylesterase